MNGIDWFRCILSALGGAGVTALVLSLTMLVSGHHQYREAVKQIRAESRFPATQHPTHQHRH